MKKSILSIFFLISFSQFAMAQNGVLFGSVKDSISGNGLAYTQIVIIGKTVNDQEYLGGITDEKGNYKIEKLPYDDYDLEVRCLGYENKTVKGIRLSSEQRKLNINILLDININSLDVVVIVANRPSVEFKADKKIIYIDPNATAGGETVSDFLVSIPEVKVDGETVTLNSYLPTILVNGKPAGPAMDDLTQIPASMISSVEIITNPSVRYSAEGVGGIINLKTKKMSDGINGMVQGSANSNNKYIGAGTINLRTKKWNIFANVYDRYNGVKENGSLEQQYNSGYSIYQESSLKPKLNRVSTRVGTDFEPDSMNVFTFFWEFSKRSGTMNYTNNWEENDLLTNRIYESKQMLNLDSRDHLISFNYTHTFKNDSELDIELSQFFGYEPTNTTLQISDSTAIMNYYSEDFCDTKESYLNANYASTIFKTWDLEAGTTLEWEVTKISNSLSSNYIDDYHHLFEMKRLINAYYLSLGKSFGKFSFKLGLRGEYVNRKLNSVDYKADDGNFDLFPNFGMFYQITDRIGLNLNYGRRIARPTIFDLTPYARINFMYPSQLNIGNPDLNPSYTNSMNFGGYYHASKFLTSFSATYMITNNDIAAVYYSNENTIYATRANIATSQKILFNANFDYYSKLFKIYRPILSLNFGWDLYDSPDTAGENVHSRYFNYHISLNNVFNLPLNFNVFLTVTYYPRSYLYASISEDIWDLNLTVRKVFKKNWTLQLSFYNILNSGRKETIIGDDFTAQRISNENTWSINLGVMYKFGKPIKTKAEVDLNLHQIETQ